MEILFVLLIEYVIMLQIEQQDEAVGCSEAIGCSFIS
jgi:hypothetical protein